MPSTLTWLDYSERDRRRALEVIDLFRETGTVDELGIGAIRDNFADLLFPGTSTIQTRACYFLLVPWIFRRLENERVPSRDFARKAREEELRLNKLLLAGPDASGLFGAQAGRALKRLASEVYWGGLGQWGIRLFSGSVASYARSLDDFYRRRDRDGSREVDPEGREALRANWHPHIPEPPDGFPGEASVALRREDAEYLVDRIQSLHPGSLLALLVARAQPADLGAEAVWELAAFVDPPLAVREQLHHARLFAVVHHGAALLYNLMLAEALDHAAWTEKYQRRLAAWRGEMASLEDELAEWRLPELWQVMDRGWWKVTFPTRTYVERWVALVKRDGPAGVLRAGSQARRVIEDREAQLKGARARLGSRRHLELWGGASGADRLDYRWRPAQGILGDIFDGLARGAGATRS